ncbi:MAG: methyltransferase domain-containing protein [Gammaproteobacteria bacterium]|nr:methyltransferase domain-containing protein [Gammaproteobacteria bacterium]
MAVMWEKRLGDTHYEVRSAGGSRRLYTNGVFHSQYNPNNPVTGNVWDLILLPIFFYKPGEIKRILMLGVGGGAVIQQLNYFMQADEIIGVEYDPVHIEIAERFFDICHDNVSLTQADAVDWIENYQGPRFDMIIDDLFGEVDGEPSRAVEVTNQWARKLFSKVNKNGMVVSNFISPKELKASAYMQDSLLQSRIHSAFSLSNPYYENAVGAFLGIESSTKQLRERLRTIPLFNSRQKLSKLNFRIRQL